MLIHKFNIKNICVFSSKNIQKILFEYIPSFFFPIFKVLFRKNYVKAKNNNNSAELFPAAVLC